MPFLFWLSVALAWMVLVVATAIALIIAAFLPAIRRIWAKVIVAETKKGAVLVETVHGMRTVKALAIENARSFDGTSASPRRDRRACSRAEWPTGRRLW